MFDIGWQELFVLAILAIIVIGPKDLPRAIRTVTHWIRKARGMARDLQDGLDDMVRESELDDIKKQANSIMGDEFDPTGSIASELDMADEQRDWSKAVENLKDATDPDRATDVEGSEAGDTNTEAPLDATEPAPAPEPGPQSPTDAADQTETNKVSG